MSASEILIFDDDPDLGHLVQDALEAGGYRTQLYADGTRAQAVIEDIRPRLIILDIMMPGLDGLTVCKALRANPAYKDMRIVVSSGKTVGNLNEQALRLGADLFIQKPFTVSHLLEKVGGLIGAPSGIAPEAASDPIFVSVLGSRSAETGTCVALEIGEMLLVLDAGPGLRAIDPLLNGRKELRVLFSHYHPDHTAGLKYLREKAIPLTLCGPTDPELPLRDVIKSTLYVPGPPKCPVSLYTLVEGTFKLTSQVRLSGLYVNHPGTTMALRIEACGKSIVFCPDNEIRTPKEGQAHDSEDKLKNFARNADLLIHDGRYTPEDYQSHLDDGHSSYANTVDFAVDAGVKRLMLIHLDPAYDEAKLKAVEAGAKAQVEGQITELEVLLARDGARFQV